MTGIFGRLKSKMRMGWSTSVDAKAGERKAVSCSRKNQIRSDHRIEHLILTGFGVPRRLRGSRLGLRRRTMLWQGK